MVIIETYKCTVCGTEMFVPRKRRRKKKHIKHMYCIRCKTKQPFEHVDEFEEGAQYGGHDDFLRRNDDRDHPHVITTCNSITDRQEKQ